MKVRLDLNNPELQKEWFNLTKNEFNSTRNTLRKLSAMDWNQVYNHKGLNWEKIHSFKTREGRELYSIRLSKKFRAIVHRKDDFLIFVSLTLPYDFRHS